MTLPVVGQTVHIQKEDDSALQGHARVLDIRTEGIYLDVPLTMDTGQGRWLDLFDSDDVHISYLSVDGAVYHFDSRVISRTTVDNLPSILIRSPELSRITRLQRRSFVRVEVSLQISVLRIGIGESSSLTTGYGMTYDLSGGGLSFRPLRPIEMTQGDQITVKFSLPTDQPKDWPISAKGNIVRESQDEYQRTLYCVNFEQISPSGQQRIVQYVFKRQIELRSKGLT